MKQHAEKQNFEMTLHYEISQTGIYLRNVIVTHLALLALAHSRWHRFGPVTQRKPHRFEQNSPALDIRYVRAHAKQMGCQPEAHAYSRRQTESATLCSPRVVVDECH